MKCLLAGLLVVLSPPAFAQSTSAPEIAFDSVANFIKLPLDQHLGEASGVAVNSPGHVYVYSRGGSSHGPAYGNTASQILESTATAISSVKSAKISTPGHSLTMCVSTRTITSGRSTRART